MSKINIPYSYNAEQSVLGGLILDNERWDEIVLILTSDDFFISQHRIIYLAIAELAIGNQPFDLITLSNLIETKNLLEQAGGFAYLADLCNNTPSAAAILNYADIVREKSCLRKLQNAGNTLLTDVQAPKAVSSAILESAENTLFNIAEQGMLQVNRESGINEAMGLLISRLECMTSADGITGTPSGFSELDKKTCGFQSGDLVLLAARPGMGKTALALAICAAAVRGKPDNHVFIFSLEMPVEQLTMRLMSMEGGGELTRIRSAELRDEEWARLAQAMSEILKWNNRLIIDDASYQTPASLRSRTRRYVRKYGVPSLIMIDYLQLVRSPGQENRTQEIAEISRCLKALGKEFACPVLALSQLNRGVEQRSDKRPNASDLRDSGALEQDADLIMFIYRDEVYNQDTTERGVAEIIIGKQRQGPIGTTKIHFDGRYTRFSEGRQNES